MNKRLCLILNPHSGKRRANRYLPEIIRLVIEHGYECVVHVTGCAGDATRYLSENAAGFDRVMCIGGDGTLNETIAGVMRSGADCPIGYIPAGSTNDYAASIGLSSDVLTAAKDALEGTVYRLDLGLFDGNYFTYTATCGAFAKTSYTTPQRAKNLLGHAAYVLEGIWDLTSLKPMHMRVETDDRTLEDDYILCMITNSLSVGGLVKLDPERVNLNDGLFEVMLVRNPTQPVQWSKVLYALSTNDLPSEMIEFFPTAKLRITTDAEIEWTFDGERGVKGTEFNVENIQRCIQLVLPDHAADTVPVGATAEEAAEAENEEKLSD